MKSLISKILIGTIILFSVVLTGCEEADGKQEEQKKEKYSSVETIKVETESYTNLIPVIGTLKAIKDAKLSYPQGGILKKIINNKGRFVSKGDTILVIDNDVLIANAAAAKAQYDLAEITFEKQEAIYKDNVNSEFQYIQSKYSRDQAKANYDLVKAQLEDSYITAPFSGIVDDIIYEEGELAPPGTPIVSLININKIKIEAGVPERYLGRIKLNSMAEIVIPNLSDEKIIGKVSFVASSVSTSNRTFTIEILIPNKDRTLKPEIIAEVYLDNGTYDNSVIIPDEVIQRTDNGYSVFVVEDDKAVAKDITILNRFENKAAVSKGLSSGDLLVTIGYQNLVHGENVKILN